MGYKSKDIAIITEPSILSLSGLPNFVQFESKPSVKTVIDVNIRLIDEWATPATLIISSDSETRTFTGTSVIEDVGGNTFFLAGDPSESAENLRQTLISDSWINSNFELSIPYKWSGGNPINGDVLNIKGKASGSAYLINVSAPDSPPDMNYDITWINSTSDNNDSISGENNTAEIELDVYADPAVFYGADDRPTTPAKIGSYVTTLSKTYSGSPLWFDVNALFSQYINYSTPPAAAGWFEPGTVKSFRFFAKVRSYTSFAFYQSNVLYLLSGYSKLSDDIDLTAYAYSRDSIKLLTNKPRTIYVRGQKEYLNFILKDDQRDSPSPLDFAVSVIYRAYSTAGDYLGSMFLHQIQRASLKMLNTCVLDIDAVLNEYDNAAIVKVALARSGAIISNDLEYEIRPECLHDLQQFSFINRFGGWDAFNSSSIASDEVKPETTVFNRTVTPGFKRGDSVETVYSVSLDNPRSIEGAVVSDGVADWLKELAASKVILDNDGYYVIIDEFDLKPSPTTKNLQTLKIKYHLSETYTND